MDDPLLRVESLEVGYRDVRVLFDVSLHVGRGEVVTLIGPNGAGKSTLLNAVMGFRRPVRGSIVYNGERIDGLPPETIVARGVAMVPEGAQLFLDMTVMENLLVGSYLPPVRPLRDRNLERTFDFFPLLRERRRQKAGTLSGGERQMLAIGRALMSNPEFLILDEPSLGLQPSLVDRVFEALEGIAKTGLTVFLVEQNVYYALEIASRAYVLENGRIVMEGTGTALLEDEHIRKVYLAL